MLSPKASIPSDPWPLVAVMWGMTAADAIAKAPTYPTTTSPSFAGALTTTRRRASADRRLSRVVHRLNEDLPGPVAPMQVVGERRLPQELRARAVVRPLNRR